MKLHFLLFYICIIYIGSGCVRGSMFSIEDGNIEEDVLREKAVSLSFNLIDEEISPNNTISSVLVKVLAEISYRNDGHSAIAMPNSIIYGHQSDGYNHIEVLDFAGQRIDVENNMDYDYVFDPLNPIPEEVTLEPGEIQIDTIDLNVFYRFSNIGEYRVRFIDEGLGIESNWDTLVVK